ncbi:hypothetical protein N431DRAFT_561324 [Stipitochalara longipes BDJ]|nr:hypothetical protein N431DRAFT_561324 [Stipitochalara longipes BDJ]
MHALFIPVCIFMVTARAATNISLIEIVSQLPTCSLTCIENGLSSIPNILTDPSVICSNITLQSTFSTCVQHSCNYTQQAKASSLNYNFCIGVPIESRSWKVTIVGLVCAPVALLAVVLRCYAKLSTVRRLGGDDWIMVASAVLLVALIVLYIINCLRNGFGRHIFNINPQLATSGFAVFYACEILYIGVITLVKCSILIFYLRIFPSKWFKIADLLVLASVIGFGVAAALAVAFQCNPIRGAWNRTINSQCINLNALAYAAGAIFVAQDLAVLILPIPQCLTLQMGRKQKLNVMVMFSIGIIACIVSIVRLKYLVTFATSNDLPWDNAIPSIWSFVEICVATICACLPAIRLLLSRYLPALFSSAAPSSYDIDRLPRVESHPYNETDDRDIRLEKIRRRSAVAGWEEEGCTVPVERGETKVWINKEADEDGSRNGMLGEIDSQESRTNSEASGLFRLYL